MKKRIALIAVGLIAAAATLGGAASAATTDHKVRQSDFITGLSDTRATGAYGFGPKGLVLRTAGNGSTDKVAEYYAASGALPATGSQDWSGSTPEPGKQIVFDSGTTGDSGYNILVGEPVYGNDWWMSTGSYIYKNHHDLCPETTGGSGSDCHGTLAEWKTAFPDAAVSAFGFSLGSGVKGDGVLKSQTFDDQQYTFTAGDAPVVVTPPGDGGGTTTPPAVTPEKHTATRAVTYKGLTYSKQNRIFNATFATNACPADDTCRGTKVRFTVYVDGDSLRKNALAGWGDVDQFRQVFSKDGGSRHVIVKANNKVVLDTMVTTN